MNCEPEQLAREREIIKELKKLIHQQYRMQ